MPSMVIFLLVSVAFSFTMEASRGIILVGLASASRATA